MSEPAGEIAVRANDWNGVTGERWVIHQQRLDAMMAPFGDAAIAAAMPVTGDHVLDIGCGAGATSFALAERVGDEGRVLGLDISASLIERAQRDAPSESPVEFLLGDAATVRLPAERFDLLYSRLGVMFFDAPVVAFAHLQAALKPGARLAFVCWRDAAENEWVRVPMDAVRDILPPTPPPAPRTPGPYAFADKAYVESILRDAGFVDVALSRFDHAIVFGQGADDAAAVDDALNMVIEVGAFSRALAGQSEDIRQRAIDAVREVFAERVRDGRVLIQGAAWIVTARNPA